MSTGYPDNYDYFLARTKPYNLAISTDKETLEAAPDETPWTLEEGLIQRLIVLFPGGPMGLLHAQIFDGTIQIFPDGSGDFLGDNLKLVFDHLNYPLLTSPYQLTVKTWNTSDFFAHKVYLYLDVSKIP